MVDYVADVYTCTKFHTIRLGNFPSHILLMFTRLVFGFFQLATPKAAAHILTLSASKGIPSRNDVPFGGTKTNVFTF